MYVGMDVHKDMCHIVQVNDSGEVTESYKIKNSIQRLDQILRKIPRNAKIALEAGTSSRPVYRRLQKLGFEIHMANPSKMGHVSSNKKTDEQDAIRIAKLLRMGELPECYVPSIETEAMRTLVRHRVSLGVKTAAVKNQIHALLALNGVKPNLSASDLFGKRGMNFLNHLELPSEEQRILKSYLRELGFLREEIETADTKLASIAEDDKRAKLLMTIPGVDYYSALAIISEIGDIKRFPDAKKLTSYTGLVPRVYESSKRKYMGHITKSGPEVLRWILISDAHSAIRKDGKLKRFYTRLTRRVGANKAIVATARKLLVIIYHMLTDLKPYEERDDDLTYRKLSRMAMKARRNKMKKNIKRMSELEIRGREMLISLGGDISQG